VFFDRELARHFDYRVKQGGQLASKMRFLAAPWSALLANELWLKNARHANAMAALLERKLRAIGQTDFLFPREASALFVRLPNEIVKRARAAGWNFQNFFQPGVYRLMCSWNTTEALIDAFIADLRA
jgi:threonine aldolase